MHQNDVPANPTEAAITLRLQSTSVLRFKFHVLFHVQFLLSRDTKRQGLVIRSAALVSAALRAYSSAGSNNNQKQAYHHSSSQQQSAVSGRQQFLNQ